MKQNKVRRKSQHNNNDQNELIYKKIIVDDSPLDYHQKRHLLQKLQKNLKTTSMSYRKNKSSATSRLLIYLNDMIMKLNQIESNLDQQECQSLEHLIQEMVSQYSSIPILNQSQSKLILQQPQKQWNVSVKQDQFQQFNQIIRIINSSMYNYLKQTFNGFGLFTFKNQILKDNLSVCRICDQEINMNTMQQHSQGCLEKAKKKQLVQENLILASISEKAYQIKHDIQVKQGMKLMKELKNQSKRVFKQDEVKEKELGSINQTLSSIYQNAEKIFNLPENEELKCLQYDIQSLICCKYSVNNIINYSVLELSMALFNITHQQSKQIIMDAKIHKKIELNIQKRFNKYKIKKLIHKLIQLKRIFKQSQFYLFYTFKIFQSIKLKSIDEIKLFLTKRKSSQKFIW